MNQLSPLAFAPFAVPLQLSKDVGKPGKLSWIKVADLVVDRSYQRQIMEAGRRNIRRIAEGFRWELFAPLVVAPRDGGKFAVLDGQHRANAAIARGDINTLPCLVIEADYLMQAKAFATINGIVTKVSPQAIHRALAAAGDSDAVRLNEVCARAGVQILGYPVAQKDIKPGQTMAVGTLGQCLDRFGEDILVQALSTITKTGDGNPGLLREGIISGACDVLWEAPKWTGPELLKAVGKIGVRELYASAIRAKADALAGTVSIRKYYGDALRKALHPILGDPGKREIAPANIRTRNHGDDTGRRFNGKPKRDPASIQHLAPDHPAILENRTLFPSTVVSAKDSERLLISGANSVKLGAKVLKGKWTGFPIYQLSLEERASCPPTCNNRLTCYGSSMPFARRHRHDEHLVPRLKVELAQLQKDHPKGFVVRLHVLGDFFSEDYVKSWAKFLRIYPALHVFGYTAWGRETPIGAYILKLTDLFWDQFAIRFSADESKPQGATTIWRKPEGSTVPEGIVCPAQTDATACCATCGMCWSAGARQKTIVFIGHGGIGNGGRKKATTAKPKTSGARKPAKDSRAATKAEDLRRAQEVHRLSQERRPPAAAKPKGAPMDERALIDDFIAKKGVRRYDQGDSGDPFNICDWLNRNGYPVTKSSVRGKPVYIIKDKRHDLEGLRTFANKVRKAKGLHPIRTEAA